MLLARLWNRTHKQQIVTKKGKTIVRTDPIVVDMMTLDDGAAVTPRLTREGYEIVQLVQGKGFTPEQAACGLLGIECSADVVYEPDALLRREQAAKGFYWDGLRFVKNEDGWDIISNDEPKDDDNDKPGTKWGSTFGLW
jgi:hypothetical protein